MKTQRSILSLLLILAMLTVAFAAIFPATVSAEGAEIQDFECLCSSDFAIGGDSVNMLLAFSIGSLSYWETGFVISFEEIGNNPNPTIGGTGCLQCQTTTAYSSFEFDNSTHCAPNGRWWVVCGLSGFSFPHYSDWIYVRAYVTDGSGTR